MCNFYYVYPKTLIKLVVFPMVMDALNSSIKLFLTQAKVIDRFISLLVSLKKLR